MGKYISSSESVIGVLNIQNLLSVSNQLRCLYPDQDLVTSAPDPGVSERNQGPVGPGGLSGPYSESSRAGRCWTHGLPRCGV